MFFADATYQQWTHFLLILVRCSALIALLPFFGSNNVPTVVKAGLSLALAIFLQPLVRIDPALFPRGLDSLVVLAFGELMVGAILGFSVRLLFAGVQIMGHLVGFQMGFSVANVLDPMGGEQVSVVGQFCYIVAILTFFAVGGHHWFFISVAESFKAVPPGQFSFSHILLDQLTTMSAEMFEVSLKLGAPVIGTLLAADVAMGILAKTVPQMNILIVGMPMKIGLGLFFLAMTMGFMVMTMAASFGDLGPVLGAFLKAM